MNALSPRDVSDEVSLILSRGQRLGGSTLKASLQASLAATGASPLRISTTFHNCPEAFRPFNALTAEGVVVRIEALDDSSTVFAGKDRDYTRADLFCWWLDADDLPGEYVLNERQEAAEHHAEEYDLDRSMGREE